LNRREAFGNQIIFDSRLPRETQTDDSNKHQSAIHMKDRVDQGAIAYQTNRIISEMAEEVT
jgi:hypothetical protein